VRMCGRIFNLEQDAGETHLLIRGALLS